MPLYEAFCRAAARVIVEQGVPTLRHTLGSGTLPAGKWHPNGFAIFHLADVEIGRLRFHVWPRGLRREIHGHPRIHCHGWHLYSLILAGTYRELHFGTVRSVPHGPLRAIEVIYENDGTESLRTTKESFDIPAGVESRYESGSFHGVEAGAFHETVIPLNAFVATLMISGHTVKNTPPMLLGPDRPNVFGWQRHALSAEELQLVRRQVDETLGIAL